MFYMFPHSSISVEVVVPDKNFAAGMQLLILPLHGRRLGITMSTQ